MDQQPTFEPADRDTPSQGAEIRSMPEPKADPLAAIAVDANALAGAIWSGQGSDVSKLIEDLLRAKPAA